MKEKRLDALEFFEKVTFENYSIDRVLGDAQKSENKEVMPVVRARVAKLMKQRLKWWQFGYRCTGIDLDFGTALCMPQAVIIMIVDCLISELPASYSTSK